MAKRNPADGLNPDPPTHYGHQPGPTVAREVATWIDRLGHKDARPVRVELTYPYRRRPVSEVFFGAAYTNPTSAEPCLYLVGETPACWRRAGRRNEPGGYESKMIFRIIGAGDSDWYVGASYTPHTCRQAGTECKPADPAIARYHPFGWSFILFRWPHESGLHGRIDHGEDTPRIRQPMEVTYL